MEAHCFIRAAPLTHSQTKRNTMPSDGCGNRCPAYSTRSGCRHSPTNSFFLERKSSRNTINNTAEERVLTGFSPIIFYVSEAPCGPFWSTFDGILSVKVYLDCLIIGRQRSVMRFFHYYTEHATVDVLLKSRTMGTCQSGVNWNWFVLLANRWWICD